MDSVILARHWARFLSDTRSFFDDRGFIEVTTRHLVPAGAFEGALDPLSVRWSAGEGQLHTSPEIEMKRLISETGLSCYQIARCFRDDPDTGIHATEFTMLEFYRVGADYAGIRQLMKDLVGHLGYEGTVREKSVAELLNGKSPSPRAGERWEDAFFRLFLDEVEPKLPDDPPTLVMDYPAKVAALAALSPDRRTAQRFEIFWKRMEICNGCVELGDPTELEERIVEEAEARRANGKAPHPRPSQLIETLERGLPPCAGVAVGLDRLFRCFAGEFPPAFR